MSSIEREQNETLQALEAVFHLVHTSGNVHLDPILRSFEDRVAGAFVDPNTLQAVRTELHAFLAHQQETTRLSA